MSDDRILQLFTTCVVWPVSVPQMGVGIELTLSVVAADRMGAALILWIVAHFRRESWIWTVRRSSGGLFTSSVFLEH